VNPIRTARLYLQPVREENAQTLWEVIQQPDLRDFQDLPDLDLAAFRRSIAQRPKELRPSIAGRFEWLVYFSGAHQNRDAGPLGWVSLRVAERATERAEIGYSIVRAHRRRGIATEAVAGLVAEAFERAQLESVRAYCVPENASSRAVLERNGFSEEGVSRHGATVQGQAVDIVAYSLERERWQSQLARPTRNRLATRS
jgi:RimJ/RimL family protein N-acetyltransferase